MALKRSRASEVAFKKAQVAKKPSQLCPSVTMKCRSTSLTSAKSKNRSLRSSELTKWQPSNFRSKRLKNRCKKFQKSPKRKVTRAEVVVLNNGAI